MKCQGGGVGRRGGHAKAGELLGRCSSTDLYGREGEAVNRRRPHMQLWFLKTTQQNAYKERKAGIELSLTDSTLL